VARVQLIRREVREFLSPSAVDLLFAHADAVVEGGLESGETDAPDRAYATVMVTIELGRCAELFREPADEATAQALAELMRTDARVRERLLALARRELARVSGRAETRLSAQLEHQVRVEGRRLLLDADAMVSLAGTAEPRR
jgi:hypothetical protein